MDTADGAGGLTEELLTVIRENTIAVMTDSSDQREAWQEMVQRLLQNALDSNRTADTEFLQAIYELTEGTVTELPAGNPYQETWLEILDGVAGRAGEEETSPAAETDVSADVMNTIRTNTVAVMTAVPEKRAEWRGAVESILEQAQANQLVEDSAFFQALLDLMDGKAPQLPAGSPYEGFLREILDGISAYEQGEAGARAPEGSGLTANLIRTIHENTVAVMTHTPERHDQWRNAVAKVLSQAEQGSLPADIAFFQAVLDILDEEEPILPEDNPHQAALKAIQDEIDAAESAEIDQETEAMLSAVRAYLTTENWDQTRRVLENNQAVLLQPEVEQLFEANIQHAREQGQNQAADMMQVHLMVLKDARQLGIPAAFERLESLVKQGAEQAAAEQQLEEEMGAGEALPTAPGLPETFTRDVILALRGSAGRKQQLFEALSGLHPQESGAEALIRVVQKALFGDAVERLGGGLPAPYDEVWQAIARGVKADG